MNSVAFIVGLMLTLRQSETQPNSAGAKLRIETGGLPGEPVLPEDSSVGRTKRVIFVGYSPEGTYLVTASRLGFIQRWDVRTGKQVSRIYAREGFIRIALSPNGREVAYSTDGGSDDPAIRVCSIETEKKLRDFREQDQARWLTFSPDGGSLAAGG